MRWVSVLILETTKEDSPLLFHNVIAQPEDFLHGLMLFFLCLIIKIKIYSGVAGTR